MTVRELLLADKLQSSASSLDSILWTVSVIVWMQSSFCVLLEIISSTISMSPVTSLKKKCILLLCLVVVTNFKNDKWKRIIPQWMIQNDNVKVSEHR